MVEHILYDAQGTATDMAWDEEMADTTARLCIKRVKYIMNYMKNAFVWMIHMENIINKNISVGQTSNEFSTDGHTIKKVGLSGHCIDLKEVYSKVSVKRVFLAP